MTTNREPSAQIGALNRVDAAVRIAAAHGVRDGEVFTLGLPVLPPNAICNPRREPAALHTTCDWSDFASGRKVLRDGEDAYVDDIVTIPTHGSTHIDALGHIIVDGTLWAGRPASEAAHGLDWGSIEPIAQTGIFGRAVVADIAGLHGLAAVPAGQLIRLEEVTAALDKQGVLSRPGDVLILHTGSMKARALGAEPDITEPGLSDELALVTWMAESGIAALGSDTFANELPVSPFTGRHFPLHRLLLHGHGIGFHEGLWLADVVQACRDDGRWDGLYVASPLKLGRASASPVNPLFVR
ncbi:cyclase family protein [Mycolicibacterium sp. YH-1]|uniref:cyclase family protein n=1 Tax=Mycolicibacterium sp. YH-1 TaxID=2908837 RepID=UPI001F4BCF32|nr:cyclase family protein [Mycolicibacterium sp. YH-1]UNB52941.1 cyclase family protein [Mycolicibacterium sp. YH-1]